MEREKKIKQLKVWNGIMIAEVVFGAALTIWFAATGALPFGMKTEAWVASMPGVLIACMAAFVVLAAVQTGLGFRTIKDGRKGKSCFMIEIAVWAVLAAVFIIMLDAEAAGWVMLFILLVPAALHASVANEIAKLS